MLPAKGKLPSPESNFCVKTASLFRSHSTPEQHAGHILSVFLNASGLKRGAIYKGLGAGDFTLAGREGEVPTGFSEEDIREFILSEKSALTDIWVLESEKFSIAKSEKIKFLIVIPLKIFGEYAGSVILYSSQNQEKLDSTIAVSKDLNEIVSASLQKRETENRLSKASHDMRNYITVAKAQSQLALMRIEPPADIKAEKNIRSLRFVIEQMDLLTRYIDEKIKPIRND